MSILTKRDQKSRLSAVRLAQVHAAAAVLGLERGFDENDLYTNLSWLSEHQERIENRLLAARRGSQSAAAKEVVHARYKDLAEVEQAFRTCKTAHLETRPIYVRTAEHTRGHVLVVMLGYLIRRELSVASLSLDLTVEEGLHQLQGLCSTKIQVEGGGSCLRIPTPDATSEALLKALRLPLSEALPANEVPVVTRKKLPTRRQPR